MKKLILLLVIYFVVSACVRVPREFSQSVAEINKKIDGLSSTINEGNRKIHNQLSENEAKQDKILNAVFDPAKSRINYNLLTDKQLDSLKRARGIK